MTDLRNGPGLEEWNPNLNDNVPVLRSLVFIPFGSNVGYAIAPLEELFFDVALELAHGDLSKVHFGYNNLDRGRPQNLPAEFENARQLNPFDSSPENLRSIARYARSHKIDLALFFDLQPTHPVLAHLRRAGVTTTLSYWGAPISSHMPKWKLFLKRARLSLARTKLDGMVFESKAMAEAAVLGRGVSRDSIDIVPLGVDTSLFRPERSDYAHRVLGIPTNRRLVFYAGHMEERKGVRVLVEAAVDLLAKQGRQDVCFVFFGDRPGEAANFDAIYRNQGIDEWIRFEGYRDDIPTILPCCHCGVIPSTGWDSFPRSSLEIQASGIPIVASRLDGIPEGIIDGETGLLYQPGNVNELVDILNSLLDQPELAKDLGARAREHILETYSILGQRKRFRDVVVARCTAPSGPRRTT